MEEATKDEKGEGFMASDADNQAVKIGLMVSFPAKSQRNQVLVSSEEGEIKRKSSLKRSSLQRTKTTTLERDKHAGNTIDLGSERNELGILLDLGREQNELGIPPLIVAAKNGHDAKVRMLLESSDIDLNATTIGGITALHLASFCGHATVVNLLLQRNARLSLELLTARTLEEEFTTLHMATCQSDEFIVRSIWEAILLVQSSSRETVEEVVNARDCIGWTPLHHAAWIGQAKIVDEILSWKYVDINAEDVDGFTALHLASWKGHLEVVASILNHQDAEGIFVVDPNKQARENLKTRERISTLQKDVDWGNLPRPRLADYNIDENHSKVTPLHYAVSHNRHQIVIELLKNPATDVQVQNSEGKSAFDMVLKGKNSEILWELLGNYKQKTEFWESLRKELSMRGYKNFISTNDEAREKKLNNCGELLKKALDRPQSDEFRDDDIHFLLLELEKKLIEINTPIQQNAKDKVSLLHHAAFAGLEKIVEILTDIPGMELNVLDSDRQTPLHYAALSGHPKVVKVLTKFSACRANAEDNFDRTALQLAIECKRHDVEKLLLERPDVRDYVDRFYRNREVYVDAANAMLLGAALIASVTFGGWLQPPAGFTPYYQLEVPGIPSMYQTYASVEQHESTRVFWIFNSLSFFFAIATVIAGAGAVLPTLEVFIGQEVRLVKRTLVATSTLLVFSVVFILGAFGAGGYASLPPIPKYERMMTLTVIFGAFSCLMSMCWFLKRLYGIRPTWWRKCERRLRDRLRRQEKVRSNKDLFSKPRPY